MKEQHIIDLIYEINQESYKKINEYMQKNAPESSILFGFEDFYFLEFRTNGFPIASCDELVSSIYFMGRRIWCSEEEDWRFDKTKVTVSDEVDYLRETLKKAMLEQLLALEGLKQTQSEKLSRKCKS